MSTKDKERLLEALRSGKMVKPKKSKKAKKEKKEKKAKKEKMEWTPAIKEEPDVKQEWVQFFFDQLRSQESELQFTNFKSDAVRDHLLPSRDQGGVRARARQIIAEENRLLTRTQNAEEIGDGRDRTHATAQKDANVPAQEITKRNQEETDRAQEADRDLETGMGRK